ncbi:MAG TPA: substrate-binding domain-containing protein [Clostridia bacterium]|nr:substrate-binding domain-containing protein [Clostridia bacterium]
MKKTLAIGLSILSAITMLAGCGAKQTPKSASSAAQSAVAQKGVLLMSTTTSTQDTGLLDYLAPLFLKDTGWKLQWTAVGTGEALKMGQNGDVDIVLCHAKASEEDFVSKGYGVKRYPVMYNDFVVVGPAEPIPATKDIKSVFTQIHSKSLPFVSRGDDSGTDKAEKKIWAGLKIDPKTNKNYIQSGQGMGDTITMANEKKAYCFTDRGTWLKMKKSSTVSIDLDIICQGDPKLKNQYGVIAVNPAKFPKVNNAAANEFINWICSARIQKLIGEYGLDKYGQALFTPNAGTNS